MPLVARLGLGGFCGPQIHGFVHVKTPGQAKEGRTHTRRSQPDRKGKCKEGIEVSEVGVGRSRGEIESKKGRNKEKEWERITRMAKNGGPYCDNKRKARWGPGKGFEAGSRLSLPFSYLFS
jgi:hypothetical protein